MVEQWVLVGQARKLTAALIPLLLLALAGNVLADDISGTVTDAGGKPISGVKIVAANPPDKTLTRAVTDGDGSYMLSGLPDGTTYLTLDPGASTFKGSTVLASVDNQGVNVVWAVSSSAPPVATATKPAKKKDNDPPAAYVPPAAGASGAAWIAGGTGVVAFATLGGLALGGAFDGHHHKKSPKL